MTRVSYVEGLYLEGWMGEAHMEKSQTIPCVLMFLGG